MRISILHMRYLPDLTGTGPLVAELASDLAARGEEVTVVTSFPHYGKTASQANQGRGVASRREEQGVRVLRTLAFPYASGTVSGRAIDYALYTGLSAAAGLVGTRPDILLAVAPPITVGLSGWAISAWRGAPLVFSAQDIWPDGLISMGKLRSRPLIGAFHRLEQFTYGAARRITVLSDGMKENLLQKGVPADKIVVIPNWVDLDAIRPVEKENAFRRQLGLEGQFVVLFAGNIGFAAGLEVVLQAADLLRREENLVFLIVGEGSAKHGLMELARSLGLQNVRFETTQPRERMSEVFGCADVSLVSLRSRMGALSVPSKTTAIMASARPVLAVVPSDSEVRRVVERSECGRWLAPEKPEALAAEIKSLRRDGDRLESLGRNGRAYAAAHFARSEIVATYHRLLRDVADEGPGE
jgi:colanic acid biosynthesis glycosyl transferase WcaI